MYIPIVFGYEVYNEIPVFLGFFYKFIEQCKKYNWPIISQENYFDNPKEIEKKLNYNIKTAFKFHDVESLKYEDIQKVDKYIIPNSITKQIISDCGGNIDNAWIDIMKKRFNYFEEYLEKTISSIKNKYNQDIKAILIWRHNASIYNACKKLNIKMIEMEFTTFRYPFYNELISYFQFSNKYSTNEFDYRYSKFKNEKNKNLPILTRKEILALFLAKENINYINKLNLPFKYELGIALGLDKDYESKANNCISNEELISGFKPYFSSEQIVYKPHPGSNFNFDSNLNVDTSSSSADFILKCKRVSSVLSNISFESMLYGKTSYVMGTMPYKNIGVSRFEEEEKIVSLEDINYILFAFFVPYDLMLEKDYLDWRITEPKESEIYVRHLEYYLNKRKIPKSILKCKGTKRLIAILDYMGFDNAERIATKKTEDFLEKVEKLEHENKSLNSIVKDKTLVINDKNQEILKVNSELNKILNSSSWKITKPLRKFMQLLKK